MSAQEKLTRSEVRCQNLEKEKAVLKNVETRLQNEIESLLRNQQSRDELVFRLESIQVMNLQYRCVVGLFILSRIVMSLQYWWVK